MLILIITIAFIFKPKEDEKPMPEDFEFEFTYGVEGFFYFSSKENVISNGYFTSENKRQTTELVLSDDQKNEIWSIIQKYKLLNYKEDYTPKTYQTVPTRKIQLKMSFDGKEHNLKPNRLGLEDAPNTSKEDENYLEGMEKIFEILTETKEFKSLPTDTIRREYL